MNDAIVAAPRAQAKNEAPRGIMLGTMVEPPKRKPGRPATGCTNYIPAADGEQFGHYRIRVTAADGSRPWIDMEPGPKHSAKWEEQIGAAKTEELRSQRLGAVPRSGAKVGAVPGESVTDWCKRWLDDRDVHGIQTRTDRSRVKKYVEPDLGPKPMIGIVRGDLEQFVELLDTKVRANEIRWKTARNCWGLVSKMFADACASKTRAIRVLTNNPALGVRGPDRGEHTGKVYLYPSEFLALVSCARVPVRWGRIFALTTYLYLRAGELEALAWEDIDLEHGIVHVHRAINREDGAEKSTKTDSPRRFPIEAALLPLLQAMHAESGGTGRVLAMPPMEDWARRLRTYLEWAGVKRAELFASDRSHKQMTFHDLRATGITWRAVRGDPPLQIMSGAGHKSFSTTQGYIREAEVLRAGFGDAFPTLPERFASPQNIVRVSSGIAQPTEIIASPAGFEPAYQG